MAKTSKYDTDTENKTLPTLETTNNDIKLSKELTREPLKELNKTKFDATTKTEPPNWNKTTPKGSTNESSARNKPSVDLAATNEALQTRQDHANTQGGAPTPGRLDANMSQSVTSDQ